MHCPLIHPAASILCLQSCVSYLRDFVRSFAVLKCYVTTLRRKPIYNRNLNMTRSPNRANISIQTDDLSMSSILSVTMGFLKWQYSSLHSRSARSSPKTVSTSATTPHRMKLVFIRAFIVHEICCAKSKPYTANPRDGATTVCTAAQPFC